VTDETNSLPRKTLAEQALDQLPENELHGKAVTEDGRTVDAKVSVQKTWANGWGLGTFVMGTFGKGRKPEGAAGIEVKKKW
jgi:hypothetical protein